MQFGRPSPADPATSPQLSVLRRPSPASRTPEEEADRERERRRRREGSERGSSHPSRRHNSDTRSRGSRSSEGSESLRDRERGRGEGDSGAKAYLKASYKEIGALEQSLGGMHRKMDSDPEAGISVLLDPAERADPSRRNDINAWAELVSMHKKLVDCHHNFLKLSLDPQVPPGLRQSPLRYNIPVRLWQVGFHLLLERLRFAWMSHNAIAHDLLTDFIYYAYQFYNGLYEDDTLSSFRTAWIEALGDLARYRMAVACAEVDNIASVNKGKHSREARIDDGNNDDDGEPVLSGASIGQEVADHWDVEERETWRITARDWYAKGVVEKPGEGRLQHHLALLCRDVRGREGHALYHFTKSLCASHPFETSRESVLPLFDSALQHQRSAPEATAMDLFVRLHGMLFTRIQLDDFQSVMSRFMERLEEDANLDGVSRKACVTQVDWLLMGVVNLTAMLQYGAENGPIRKALAQEGAARRRQHIADGIVEQDGEDDASQVAEAAPTEELAPLSDGPPPITFTHALELSFTMLDFVFKHPFRQQGLYQVLNPYLIILLTFLATIFRQPAAGAPLVTSIPWRHLAEFLNRQNLELREETRLVTPSPLPEDWMMRGMEWIGRRVYERGFWKTKSNSRGSSGGPAIPRTCERFTSEVDVLLANFDSGLDLNEGVVEDVDGPDATDGPVAVNERRRRRLAWAAGVLAAHVEGFVIDDGRVAIRGVLSQVIDAQEAQRAREKAEAEAWASRRPADHEEYVSESDEDDPALSVLRERKRHLRSVLKLPRTRAARRAPHVASQHRVVPGYTILIFDTNVLLSSLGLFAKVVEGGQWSVIVPLPVITELDGLSKNAPPLGSEAQSAVAYLEARIRTHALCLKIQTTRGNYLTDLLIRAEHLDFKPAPNAAKSMDDLILDVAQFQAKHFRDRSGVLGMPKPDKADNQKPTQVLLITFDRNMRIKARARGIEAADEREMAAILGK